MNIKELNEIRESLFDMLDGLCVDDILCILSAQIAIELGELPEDERVFYIGKMNYTICNTLLKTDGVFLEKKDRFYYLCMEEDGVRSTAWSTVFETSSKEEAQEWVDEAPHKRTWFEKVRDL